MIKLMLITPFGMSELGELFNILATQKVRVQRRKRVLVTDKLVAIHFESLGEDQKQALISEWSGTEVEALLVEDSPELEQLGDKMSTQLYITPAKYEAWRDILLWYPEYLVETHPQITEMLISSLTNK